MNEKEYREYPALNSTRIMRFLESPATVLLPQEPKSYFAFGKMFESLARDTWTGDGDMWDRYFVCEAAGSMPERLVKLLDEGVDLADAYVMKKDGTRNYQQKNLHFWLDECQKQPGKWPISQDEYVQLTAMVHNLGMAPIFSGITVAQLLEDAEWQVPHIWTSEDGIEKKCLFDAVGHLDNGKKVVPDLKALASLGKFPGDYRARYWLQDRHYIEGALNLWGYDGLSQDAMIFAVSAKEEPYLGQCFETDNFVDPSLRSRQHAAYELVCREFVAWEKAGSPAIAWREKATIVFWRK